MPSPGAAYRRRFYALVYMAYALSDPTQMEAIEVFPRFLLGAFPLFMGWGAWLAELPRVPAVTLTGSAALLVVFSGLWGIWAWVA